MGYHYDHTALAKVTKADKRNASLHDKYGNVSGKRNFVRYVAMYDSSGSIAKGNRHGGPHKHERERTRWYRQQANRIANRLDAALTPA